MINELYHPEGGGQWRGNARRFNLVAFFGIFYVMKINTVFEPSQQVYFLSDSIICFGLVKKIEVIVTPVVENQPLICISYSLKNGDKYMESELFSSHEALMKCLQLSAPKNLDEEDYPF